MSTSWDEHFVLLSRLVAQKSKDRSTKVGCVIVGPENEIRSTGYNGFPRGCDDEREEWHQRPKKYLVTEHAERNAIANAARTGIPLKGCKAYITGYPCADCARMLIQAGIVEVIIDREEKIDEEFLKRWKDHFDAAEEMFSKTGIKVRKA